MTLEDEWLIAHTFYCKGLSARITPEQCRINKEQTGSRYELAACVKCKDYDLAQKEALPMSISQNVKDETIAALRSSQNQSQAAAKLGIKQPSLYWRIMQDKEIHAVADELGFLRKKAHERNLPHPMAVERKGKNYPFKDEVKPELSASKPEESAKPDPEHAEGVKPVNKELHNSAIPGKETTGDIPGSPTAEIIIKLSGVPITQLRGVMEMMGAGRG
jgi:hypothetical protein